jgi:hypothetical protein
MQAGPTFRIEQQKSKLNQGEHVILRKTFYALTAPGMTKVWIPLQRQSGTLLSGGVLKFVLSLL